ncbi:hypothetical protein B0O99DRAFT_645753 [Bisporella sp. PMI_857]|nr:hypothetical protein B0O99DRAFT_645753 [Bisporella sp. PMI_857]
MTNPTSRTPRRSHIKSRNGCATCKRRHLRCDETLPQCQNCTKYNCRCPYQDILENEQRDLTPKRPNLLWTLEIEADIRSWQQTGRPPFPSLHLFPAIPFEHCSLEDLRLIHHVASISSEFCTHDSSNFTIWVRHVPLFLKIGATYSFVMHSLLALSGSHLAWLTGCPLTANIAFEHRGIALKGLYGAIGSFLRENSDAVLAASLLLLWQATEWRDWTRLMHGTSSIIDAMQPWKSESQFEDFIVEKSTFSTAPPPPDACFNYPKQAYLDALQLASAQLRRVEAYLVEKKEGTESISQLITFVQRLQMLSPSDTTTQRFDMLDPLRTWLLWVPVMYLRRPQMPLPAFVVLAYYYTVALIVEPLFPEIGAAYFGSLSLNAIEEIVKRLFSVDVPRSSRVDLNIALSLIAYPMDMAYKFRIRMGLVQLERVTTFPHSFTLTSCVPNLGKSMS